jgi:hypothetical protein
MRPILALAALAALALTLAACGKSERSAVSLEVNGDIANQAATITCKESTSGTCHVLFQSGTTTKRASAAVGATTTVSGLPAGTGFCGGYAPPEPAGCKPIVLVDGRQVVRHERTERH